MACITCRGSILRDASRALAKAAAARLRGLGMLGVSSDWEGRAELCERCPLRVVRRGVSYCGNPYLEQPDRDESIDGCGCPCRDKAKSPGEHCPIDDGNRPAQRIGETCSCKWCAAGAMRDG